MEAQHKFPSIYTHIYFYKWAALDVKTIQLHWQCILYTFQFTGQQEQKEDQELPLFDLVTVASATNNFSDRNMIGKGGFGFVYKVMWIVFGIWIEKKVIVIM